jgi:hypothetical protein
MLLVAELERSGESSDRDFADEYSKELKYAIPDTILPSQE